MAPIADFILANVPLPKLPSYLTRWEPGVTPLSTQKEVATALVSYLAIIFGIQAFMKNKTAVRANGPFQVHNTILYVGSGILLVLMIEEVLPLWWKGGWFFAICNDNAWTQVKLILYCDEAIFLCVSTQRLEFYYMINYYFKYLELIDTVFLAIKKKTLGKFLM
jgi:fatty acid elongase 3